MCKLDILMFFFGWDRVQTSVLGQRLLWRRKGAAEIERPFGLRRYFTLTVCASFAVFDLRAHEIRVVAVGIKFGAKYGMKSFFFCYRPLCAYTTYIHSHIQYKIKLALCTGWAKEKPHLLNDLAWDNNFFLKNYTTYPIILSPMFFTQQTVQKNEVWFGSLCSLHRRLYSRVVITTLPQSSKSN